MPTSWLSELITFQRDHPVPDPPATPAATTPEHSIAEPDRAVELDAEAKARYERRLAVVRDFTEHPDLTWAELASRHGVSVGQARYYVETAEDQGEGGLVPGVWSKHTALPIEVQFEILRLYRDDMRRTPMDIYQHAGFQRLVASLNARVSYKQVWYFLRSLDEPDAGDKRSGRPRRLLPPHLSDGRHAYQAKRPLEMIQVDETIFDVLTRTREGHITKRVHILWAIDVATRVIVAFRVCFKEVTEHDVRLFYAQLLGPKAALVKAARATNDWPAHGCPEIILSDRGRVFTARGVREALLALGIVLEYAPAYQPHYKAIVERFQRTFNQLLAHRLPGTVRSGSNRRRYQRVRVEALKNGLTPSQLTAIITRFVVDGYHQRFHRGIRDFPIKRWRELVAKYGPPRQLGDDERSQVRLRLLTQVAADRQGLRTLSKHGYSVLGHFFTPQIPAPKQAVLSYDPRDMRRVSVFTTTGVYICEAYLRNWDQSMPVSATDLRERNRRASSMVARSRDADRTIAEIIEDVAKGKKVKAKDATKLEMHRANVARADRKRAARRREVDDSLDLRRLA